MNTEFKESMIIWLNILTEPRHKSGELEMESGWQLVFTDPRMFGRIRYAEGCSPPKWWSDLPPQVLSDQFTFAEMNAFLDRRAKAPLKAVLLMQARFPRYRKLDGGRNSLASADPAYD